MKSARHEKIIELVQEFNIETQEELSEKLNNSGFTVTQATVSRDIRDLNLTKASYIKGKQKYIILEKKDDQLDEKFSRILKDGFLSMELAVNLLVIKTVPGMAMAVAAALDALNIDGIVGSIAGDDTIMCAIKTIESAQVVKSDINEILKK